MIITQARECKILTAILMSRRKIPSAVNYKDTTPTGYVFASYMGDKWRLESGSYFCLSVIG